jgi:hypothetical protein
MKKHVFPAIHKTLHKQRTEPHYHRVQGSPNSNVTRFAASLTDAPMRLGKRARHTQAWSQQ